MECCLSVSLVFSMSMLLSLVTLVMSRVLPQNAVSVRRSFVTLCSGKMCVRVMKYHISIYKDLSTFYSSVTFYLLSYFVYTNI